MSISYESLDELMNSTSQAMMDAWTLESTTVAQRAVSPFAPVIAQVKNPDGSLETVQVDYGTQQLNKILQKCGNDTGLLMIILDGLFELLKPLGELGQFWEDINANMFGEEQMTTMPSTDSPYEGFTNTKKGKKKSFAMSKQGQALKETARDIIKVKDDLREKLLYKVNNASGVSKQEKQKLMNKLNEVLPPGKTQSTQGPQAQMSLRRQGMTQQDMEDIEGIQTLAQLYEEMEKIKIDLRFLGTSGYCTEYKLDSTSPPIQCKRHSRAPPDQCTNSPRTFPNTNLKELLFKPSDQLCGLQECVKQLSFKKMGETALKNVIHVDVDGVFFGTLWVIPVIAAVCIVSLFFISKKPENSVANFFRQLTMCVQWCIIIGTIMFAIAWFVVINNPGGMYVNKYVSVIQNWDVMNECLKGLTDLVDSVIADISDTLIYINSILNIGVQLYEELEEIERKRLDKLTAVPTDMPGRESGEVVDD